MFFNYFILFTNETEISNLKAQNKSVQRKEPEESLRYCKIVFKTQNT